MTHRSLIKQRGRKKPEKYHQTLCESVASLVKQFQVEPDIIEDVKINKSYFI
jgi:hypothetical protein